MADIDIEREPSRAWLWWLLGAVALLLVLWALLGSVWDEPDDEGVLAAPAAVEEFGTPPGEAVAVVPTPAVIVVTEIVADPARWSGTALSGEVQVDEVPTDRGFWITDQGQRLFAILGDGPQEQPLDINPNQRLRISEGMVYGPDQLASIPGGLDDDTRRIAEAQPAVLYVHEDNVEIIATP